MCLRPFGVFHGILPFQLQIPLHLVLHIHQPISREIEREAEVRILVVFSSKPDIKEISKNENKNITMPLNFFLVNKVIFLKIVYYVNIY